MAKKIKFPLKMKNGAEVRTLDELKENFDLESVLGYFADGRLTTWLADRYYDDKVAAVSALSVDTTDLNAKLCEILEVEYKAEEDSIDLKLIQHRNEKYRILSVYTDEKDILNNIDIVAMDQNELYDILDKNPERVYLYGEKFDIPFGKKNVCYTGVNNPLVILEKEKYVFEYSETGITFKNIRYEDEVNPYTTRGELLYIENKYNEAFPLVKEAAENGNPRAMYILAMSYKDGSGVEFNQDLKCEWLNRANGLGEPLSMINYAYFCCKDKAEKLRILSEYFVPLKKLADSGDVLAQFEYGDYLCSETDDKKEIGVLILKEIALRGFVPAKCLLGIKYYFGEGIEEDLTKSFEWLNKAAEQGFAQAQDWIGFFYNQGIFVKRNDAEASKWFGRAAEQGYANAQYNLACLYEWGNGVTYNMKKAVDLYQKAAKQGHEDAQNRIKKLGTGVYI